MNPYELEQYYCPRCEARQIEEQAEYHAYEAAMDYNSKHPDAEPKTSEDYFDACLTAIENESSLCYDCHESDCEDDWREDY